MEPLARNMAVGTAFCPEGDATLAKNPHDKPIEAVAEEGEVLLDGPDGMAESFTPNAAKRSAKHIEQAAKQAEQTGKSCG